MDIAGLAAYYGEASLSLELRFLDAISHAFDALSRMPAMGSRRESFDPRLLNMRVWPIPEFPRALIFYCVQDGGIEVIRVLHAERDIDAILSEEAES